MISAAASLLILLVGATSAFAASTGRTTTQQVNSYSSGGAGLGSTPTTGTATGTAATDSGTTATAASTPLVKWTLVDGVAEPTATGTPQTIVNIIGAANRIAFRPYIYGGGHKDYVQLSSGVTQRTAGYDCSGSVSFALHADGIKGNLLSEPLDSSQFESWGKSGPGKWITIYTNYEHAYMVIAGLRFDTVAAQENVTSAWKYGDRWTANIKAGTADTAAAFVVRHPTGW